MVATAELPHGKRRVATVLFADLKGYSRLAEQLDPEDLAALMNRVLAGATRIVEAHGGIVNQYSGDDVKALFGVPLAHDDDPRRAVATAFELHRFMRSAIAELERPLGQPLALRTAIATGVIVTQVRDQREGLFGVTGDTINTAARLVASGATEEIVIDATTKRAVDAYYETAALGSVKLRGKQRPVEAFRVLRPIPRSWFEVPRERGLSAYAGRSREDRALDRHLAHAHAGEGSVVAVEGQPGIGKSRLLYELRRRAADDFRVLVAGCEGQAQVPFQPFLRLVRELLDVHDADPPDAQRTALIEGVAGLGAAEVEAALPLYLQLLSLRTDDHPIPAHLHGDALRGAILDGLTALLVAAAARQPLLVLLEDWHWADASSSAALRRLARVAAQHAMLVVVTARPHDDAAWRDTATQILRLHPLAAADARVVVRSRLGAATRLSDERLQALHEQTGGNPLFLEEVCQSLIENAAAVGLDAALAAVDVPPSVEAVIQARVDRLADDDRELLRTASVVGYTFARTLLERVAAERAPDVECGLARLVEHDLIDPAPERDGGEPRYRFRHAITRDVVYASALRRERRDLHLRVAEAIEATTPIERLATQYEALADHYERGENVERAAHFAACAAEKAAASFSLDAARMQYRRAIALLDRLGSTPERLRRRIDLSEAWAAASVYDPSAARCDVLRTSYELAERIGYRRGATRAVYWMGWFEHAFGNHETALAHFERALEIADPVLDHRLVSQLHTNLGQSYYHGAEFERAVEHLTRAIALRRGRTESQRTIVVANALGYLGLVDAERGDFAAARRRVQEALAIVRHLEQRQLEGSVLTMVTYVHLFQGDWEGALAHAAEMQAIADAIGGPYIAAMSRTARGYARVAGFGDWGGLADLEDAVRTLESSGSRLSMSVNDACLAEALALAGEPERAATHAERALARSTAFDRLGEAQAHRALALAHAVQRAWDTARDQAQRALQLATERGAARDAALTHLAQAEIERQAGDAVAARFAVAQARDAFARFGMPFHLRRADELAQALGA